MTENLAGRGEGLAGLAEAIKLAISAGADLRYDEYGVMEMPIGHLATKWDIAQAELQRILAALEAAAPAGTAQAQQEFTHDLFAAIHRTNYPGCGDCENFPTTRDVEMFDAIHKVLKRYALATPSPQAGQELPRKCFNCEQQASSVPVGEQKEKS